MFLNHNNKFIKIKQSASRVWLFFLDLIFPLECLGCGRGGGWLCPECFKSLKLKSRQYCLHCKKANDFGQFCPACQNHYSLDGVWIAAWYEDKIISQAIKSLKYHFISGLAEVLGKWLILFMNNLLNQARILRPSLKTGVDWRALGRARNLPLAILNFKADLVIPVPLARKRLRWRGFNQAEILARILAAHFGLELDSAHLVRLKHKTAQAKLNEAGRLVNVKDCFAWPGKDLSKRNIILVDDVVTTGATLNECARVLKAHGAGEVWGLVAAKG